MNKIMHIEDKEYSKKEKLIKQIQDFDNKYFNEDRKSVV